MQKKTGSFSRGVPGKTIPLIVTGFHYLTVFIWKLLMCYMTSKSLQKKIMKLMGGGVGNSQGRYTDRTLLSGSHCIRYQLFSWTVTSGLVNAHAV